MLTEKRWTSTNNRWGLAIVAPDEIDWNSPQYGEMVYLGKLEGHRTYQFTPTDHENIKGNWYYVCGDSETLAGAVNICSIGLQSNNAVNLWALSPFSALRIFGYARRSAHIVAFKNGEPIDLPTGVMAAMGLLPVEEKEPVEPDLPEPDGALAEALRKAGL